MKEEKSMKNKHFDDKDIRKHFDEIETKAFEKQDEILRDVDKLELRRTIYSSTATPILLIAIFFDILSICIQNRYTSILLLGAGIALFIVGLVFTIKQLLISKEIDRLYAKVNQVTDYFTSKTSEIMKKAEKEWQEYCKKMKKNNHD